MSLVCLGWTGVQVLAADVRKYDLLVARLWFDGTSHFAKWRSNPFSMSVVESIPSFITTSMKRIRSDHPGEFIVEPH